MSMLLPHRYAGYHDMLQQIAKWLKDESVQQLSEERLVKRLCRRLSECPSDEEIQWAKNWLYGNRFLSLWFLTGMAETVKCRVSVTTALAQMILDRCGIFYSGQLQMVG